jgi:hypothetical protein
MRTLRFVALAFLACMFEMARQGAAHDCGHHGHHGCAGCVNCAVGGDSVNRSLPGSAFEESTLEGTIAEVVFLPGTGPASAMVEVRIQSGGTLQWARLGPSGVLSRGGIRVREGEVITVKGFSVTSADGVLIVACQVRQGTHTLVLRDARGGKAW